MHYMFSRALHQSPVFPRLAQVTFSRALQQSPVFPRLAPVTCFPHVLGNGWLFVYPVVAFVMTRIIMDLNLQHSGCAQISPVLFPPCVGKKPFLT